MKLPFHDARMARLKGRKAALDNEPRLSPYRAHRLQGWRRWDAEWCRGYDEASRAPDAGWFDADGQPYRCGAATKAGRPCQALVDKRAGRCGSHREKPPPHPGLAAQLPLPSSDAWHRWTDAHRRSIEATRGTA
jgi:hypothetical protein